MSEAPAPEGSTPARDAVAVASEPGTRLQAVVVPHTHWDREWYAPLEVMRFHLVAFMDELIEVLETEPNLPVFLLDGQTVIVDDYLAVRPDQRQRLDALIAAGRLRPGPSFVQPDEFHISGEALVRNFLVGLQDSAQHGWVMREGYLPDTFGHVHQLPQILRGFGIKTFYAMRGFGYDPHELGTQFGWQGPDGSVVRVEWLLESYSNAAVLAKTSADMLLHHGALVRYDSLAELVERMSARIDTGALLLLNGGDHLRVQADLPETVTALAADAIDTGLEVDLQLGSLEDFSALLDQSPPPTKSISGELRSGRYHAVFDGIGSTRTPLKAMNERTESMLVGVAERLDALATLLGGRTSRPMLAFAWRELLKNYAHDSICGCSVDEVHEDMVTRFRGIQQSATAIADHALTSIAARTLPLTDDEIGIVVVNLSARPRSGPVTVEVLADRQAPIGTRRFGWLQGADADLSHYRLIDPQGDEIDYSVTPAASVKVHDTLNRRKELLLDQVEFFATEVPPLGSAIYRLVPGVPTAKASVPKPGARPVLDNGIIRVDVAADGTLTLTHLASQQVFQGLLGLIDDADAGDEYGHAPIPDDQPITASKAPEITLESPTSLRITRRMAVPARLAPGRRRRSDQLVELVVSVTATLWPESDGVGLKVEVDNPAEDHRLRLRFPTNSGRSTSVSESAFGVVHRDGTLPQSDGWMDQPSGVLPMRRFVAAPDEHAGLQVLAEGLHEYAVLPDGEIEVTLLRSVGWLARVDHPLRPHKIGPELPTPGAQCLGHHEFRMALRPFADQADPGHLYEAAEAFSVPLQAVSPWGQSADHHQPARAQLGLGVSPASVVLSAVKTSEAGDGLVVRVFNSTNEPVVARFSPAFGVAAATLVRLDETEPTSLPITNSEIEVALRPAEIATVHLALTAS